MKKNRTVILLMILLISIVLSSCRKGDYYLDEDPEVITDNGFGTGSLTWTSDKSYLLEGFVYVNDGQELKIEAGCVIRARSGQGSGASALIVARGGRIIAQGTASRPIIFTVEGDDLQGSVPLEAKGLWGGIIILGKAPVNINAGEAHIEGIPLSEPRAVFGGGDTQDDSGILSYVSIRHGGTNIGEGNEINGLTLGGVGSETIIDHVEVISNADDGFEFFGGNVNCSYLAAAFCEDDAFDIDLGYQGKAQFWFGLQDAVSSDKFLECSGGIDPVNGLPLCMPQLFNASFIGNPLNKTGMSCLFNNFAAGALANSLIVNKNQGVYIEYVENANNSFDHFESGLLELRSNLFYEVADNDADSIFNIWSQPYQGLAAMEKMINEYFSQAGNFIADPGIHQLPNSLNPIPASDIHGNLAPLSDPWFEEVSFRGAFGNYNWLAEWSLLSESGYITDF